MTTVGETLKRAREALRLDLRAVAQTTKIQPWVLEALEADQLHTTMSPVYTKSFLMKYAHLLRLDPEPLLAQLLPPAPSSAQPTEPAPAAAAGDAPWTPIEIPWGLMRRVAAYAGGIAVIVALVLANPLPWIAQHLPTRSALFGAGGSHQEASVTISKPAGPAPAELILALEPSQPLELTVRARRRTWVLIKADGKLVAQRPMTAGTQELWRAKRRFELVVGAPASTEIQLNGHPISSMAMAHQGRLLITHQRIQPLSGGTPTPLAPARATSAATGGRASTPPDSSR